MRLRTEEQRDFIGFGFVFRGRRAVIQGQDRGEWFGTVHDRAKPRRFSGKTLSQCWKSIRSEVER